MGLSLINSKEFIAGFFKDPVKGMLLLCVVAIGTLFTFLYNNQQAEKALLRENWTKCENGNYQRDVKISILEMGKYKSDSILNRVLGRLEAIEELKKQKNETAFTSNRTISATGLQ